MGDANTKVCKGCGVEKPLSDYYWSAPNKYGKRYPQSYCKPCFNKQVKERKKDGRYKEKSKQYRKENKEKIRLQNYRNKIERVYGITFEQYQQMVESQGNKCYICGVRAEETPKGVLSIDHCHQTDAVRGLLCDRCNTALGNFDDSIENLSKAIEYLRTKERWIISEGDPKKRYLRIGEISSMLKRNTKKIRKITLENGIGHKRSGGYFFTNDDLRLIEELLKLDEVATYTSEYEDEVFTDLKGHEGAYIISNYGTIISCQREIDSDQTESGKKIVPTIVLRPSLDQYGNARVILRTNKRSKAHQVARLVWESFMGEIPKNHSIKHINGINPDNRIDNLTLESRVDLRKRQKKNPKRGETNWQAKITNAQAQEIREKFASGKYKQCELADEYGISRPAVNRIIKRISYK